MAYTLRQPNDLPAATPYDLKSSGPTEESSMLSKFNMLKSILPQQEKEAEAAPKKFQPLQAGMSNSLQRRMSDLQQAPQMQLAEGIDALKYIQDPAQRQAYAAPLLQAQLKAKGGA